MTIVSDVTVEARDCKRRKKSFSKTLVYVNLSNLDPIVMESTQFHLNDYPVTITADPFTIKRLNEDDQFLSEYINKGAKAGQFNFLFTKDPSLRRIVVKRIPRLAQVWNRKGRPSETDNAANLLLLTLRTSEKYVSKFKNGSARNKLWDELANEMRDGGYDVDGQRCSTKFMQLLQGYQKAEGLDKGGISADEDEDEEPRSKKRKKEEDDMECFKKLLKRNGEMKMEKFKEVCVLLKKRNELMEEKVKQNREVIGILSRLLP